MPKHYDSGDIATRLRNRVEESITSRSASDAQRSIAWQQFMLQPTGSEEPDYPTIQSPDVNAMVTAVEAQAVTAFSTDTVVTYEAKSAEDEQAAKMESRADNKIVVEDNGGYGVISDTVQNALMFRNGYAKVYWDKDITIDRMRHDNVEPEDLPFLTDSEQGIQRRLISYDPEKKT